MRKYALLLVCLVLVLLLVLFRDFLLVFLLERALSQAGVKFSCKSLAFEDGRLKLTNLVIKEPNLELKAAKGEFGFSLREWGLEVSLEQVEGSYTPDSFEPFSPPKYLASLSLKGGKFFVKKPPLKINLESLLLTGLKDFWKDWRPKKAFASENISASLPATQESLAAPLSQNSSEAFQIEIKADFSRLPQELKEKLLLKKGILKVNLGFTPQGAYRFPFNGRLILEEAVFERKGRKLTLAGQSNFSGIWDEKTKHFELQGKGIFEPLLSLSYRLEGAWREKGWEISKTFLHFKAPLHTLSPLVDYGLRGDLDGTLEAKLPSKSFAFAFSFEDGGFLLDEERVGEGFFLEGKISGVFQKGLFLRGQVHLNKGEIFWAPWYYALSKPLKLSFSGAFQRDGFSFDNLEIEGPFKAAVKGLRVYPSVSWPDEGRLSLAVEDFWQPLVAEPFGEEHPILKEISPRGRLELREKEQKFEASFRGEIDLKDHQFEGLSFTAGYDLSGACEGFALSWREVRGPFFEASALDLRGKTCPPKVSLDPFEFFLLKGELSAGGGQGNIEKKFFVLKRLLLTELKPPLPEPWDTLSPRISGRFEEILFQKGLLKGRGVLEIELARGKIMVRDPFFAPGILPRYGGEVEFFGLDLAELSRALGLGLITGRLRGRIKDLVMVGKLPERFELWLEDDSNYRGSRRISLKAVRQISELGGGSATIFMPFVKNLRYKRLGIYCRLQNDVFYLRGLIKEGEREYLLKGPKLFGVDVINQNPGGAISFKEMLRRLKRILEEGDENAAQNLS